MAAKPQDPRSPTAAHDVAAVLLKLLFHPAGLDALELKVWTIFRAEPEIGVCAVSARAGHHRESVAREAAISPTPDRGDPTTGQPVPTRYVALDPSPGIGTGY